jgi:type I restriction enzyme S subunit
VIPEDWDVSYVGAEFTVQLGKMLDAARNVGTPKPYIGNRSVQWGRIDLDGIAEVPMTPSDLQRFRLRRGDLLVCEGGEIGRAAIWDEPIPECYYQKALHRLRPKGKYDVSLMMSMLQHWSSTRYLANYVTQTSIAHLPKEKLEVVPLPVPSPTEQRAIAESLSDVDGLLAALEALIAKKRAIKQAAMQQLLTGKSRLPSFSGEWETKWLRNVAHIKTGSRNNEDKVADGQYPFFVRSDVVERINTYSHDCEAILVPGEGRIGSIFHYIRGRFDVHQRVYAITQFAPNVSAEFVFFYIAKNFGAWAMQNTVKATVDSLRLPTFQNFEMRMPPTVDEQSAIASVLSDMDAEIAVLEQRQDKIWGIKQGMMQQLLTGRVRLVNLSPTEVGA